MNQLRLVPRLASSGAELPASIDEACLDAYQSTLNYLLSTLERLGVAPAEVEDVAHEVFLVLRRTWTDYDVNRPFKPYLFGIAFRVASSHRRRWWREIPCDVVDLIDHAPSPDRELETRQARALVLAALEKIPLPRRAVLVMHDLDQLSVQEVAATLSIPLFTVYSRLRKARLELESAIREIQRRSPLR